MIRILTLVLLGFFWIPGEGIAQEPAWQGSPYVSSYVNVLGSKMHYVDTASEGDPIVLVHGIPTWSYLWRNVAPQLETRGRVIAVDLIGFGRSDKPKIGYQLIDQIRYFDAWIDALQLKNVTLVVHDMGSFVGLNYAMSHPENVNAIVCMESMLLPDTWENMDSESATFMKRSREDPKFLYQSTVEHESLTGMIQALSARQLSEQELAAYAMPFQTKQQRETLLPLWVDFPISGSPPVPHKIQVSYLEKLTHSKHPKLVLTISDPLVGHKRQLAWVKAKLPNLTIENVGQGKHFMQEDQPKKIGKAISDWLLELQQH